MKKGKRCIGYVPPLQTVAKFKNKSKKRKHYEKLYYHFIVECLMKSINQYQDGIMVRLFDGQTKWLYPILSHFITDWPEGQKVCGMYEGAALAVANCRVCEAPVNTFSKTHQVHF